MSIKKRIIGVEGMHCASCVASAERALQRVDGVEAASVNLATEMVHVTYDAASVGFSDLADAVSRAGYALAQRENASEESAPESEIDKDNRYCRKIRLDLECSGSILLPVLMFAAIGSWKLPPLWVDPTGFCGNRIIARCGRLGIRCGWPGR